MFALAFASAITALFALPTPSMNDDSILAQRALEALRAGEQSKAIELATTLVTRNRKAADRWMLRAYIYSELCENEKAVSDYSEAISIDPKNREAWQRRGEVQFRMLNIKESIEDFDHYLQLAPDQKPHHWQRGISLYYAKRYAEGKAQFELHRTVNPQDVENAVWHFLCTARLEGLEAAQKQLIPISEDARVPMAQIHRLFSGKGTVKDVMTAAREAKSSKGGEDPLFYAYLYLSLYYDATRELDKAKIEIDHALDRTKGNNYMFVVARVHYAMLYKNNPVSRVKPASPSSARAGTAGSSKSPTRP